ICRRSGSTRARTRKGRRMTCSRRSAWRAAADPGGAGLVAVRLTVLHDRFDDFLMRPPRADGFGDRMPDGERIDADADNGCVVRIAAGFRRLVAGRRRHPWRQLEEVRERTDRVDVDAEVR